MRTHRVHCRLSAEELAKLHSAAKRDNVKPTPALRQLAFAYLEQRFLLPPTLEETLSRTLQELRRVGTSVNQIAAKANALARIGPFGTQRAVRIVAELEESLDLLRSHLTHLKPVPCSSNPCPANP